MKRSFLLVSVFLGGCAAESAEIPAPGNDGPTTAVEARAGHTPNANDASNISLPSGNTTHVARLTVAGGEGSDAVYTTTISNDGVLGEWRAEKALPNKESVTLVHALEGYLAIGPSGNVLRSIPDLDGRVAHWRVMDQVKQVEGASVASSGSSLFLIGGAADGAAVDWTFSSALSNGLPQTFAADTALPTARAFAAAARLGGYTFVTGGSTAAGSTSDVIVSRALPNGGHGKWKPSASLPAAVRDHAMFTNLDDLYVVGGQKDVVSDEIVKAHMSDDGSLGEWKVIGKLPAARAGACVTTSGNRVVVIGGYQDKDVSHDVFTTTIEADGSLAPWKTIGKLPVALSHAGCGIN